MKRALLAGATYACGGSAKAENACLPQAVEFAELLHSSDEWRQRTNRDGDFVYIDQDKTGKGLYVRKNIKRASGNQSYVDDTLTIDMGPRNPKNVLERFTVRKYSDVGLNGFINPREGSYAEGTFQDYILTKSHFTNPSGLSSDIRRKIHEQYLLDIALLTREFTSAQHVVDSSMIRSLFKGTSKQDSDLMGQILKR